MTDDVRRGLLVAVEGPDRAGKTTAARRLAAERGFTYMKRPDRGTATGQLLDRFIKRQLAFSDDHAANERAAQCLFAANNHEGRADIVRTLQSGGDVVMDRYVLSGIVYHSLTVDEDASQFIVALNRGMPVPDVVVVFEVDAAAAATRAEFGAERNDSVEFQRRLAGGFRYHARDAHFLDANRAPDDVYADLVAIVQSEHIQSARAEPLHFYG
jgi:dTMP kinase